MYLARLEIQGFKSFANGFHLDFQRGITAIVGPNGSGKSNVADAIRWVLGEQSLKLLRGKKSDDVIFAGSDKKSRLGTAEVSLILNNADGFARVDYPEIVITRRIYRDGEGEYLINRRPARLQDIQLLLAQANFGQRTYSVIGQGMIDSFLMSSPQDRKHLFDEAAGVRQYQLKREQAVHKLSQSKDNLAQGEAIMMEIEPRLRSLTRQVRRLERREQAEQELRTKQTLYFGLRWQESQGELQQTQKEHGVADQGRAKVAKELEAIHGELEKIERERSATEQFAGLQKRYTSILDEKNKLLEQQAGIKAKLDVAARQAGQAETVFRQHRQQELQRDLAQVQEELEVVAQLHKTAVAKLQREEPAVAKFRHQEDDLRKRLTAAQQQAAKGLTWAQVHTSLAKWLEQYSALINELSVETPPLDRLRKQAAKLRDELDGLTNQVGSAAAGIDPQALLSLQQEFLDVMTQRHEVEQRLTTARAEVQRLDDQHQRLTDNQKKLQADFEAIRQESSVEELAKTHPEQAYAIYVDQAKKIDDQLAGIDQRLKEARQNINNFNTEETSKKDRLFGLQKEFRNTQHRLNTATNQVNGLQVQLARLEQHQEDLRREIEQAMGAGHVDQVTASANGKLRGDVEQLAEEIGHLRHQLELIGGIDDTVTAEYSATNERWEFLSKQAEDLKSGIASLDQAIGELDNVIAKKFDAAFKKINAEFNTYFRTLFRGGRAELVLVKEVVRADDDLTEAEAAMAETADAAPAEPKPKPAKDEDKVITGIEIKATPPGKKLQFITMLSGGERALTSIALLCAIISNNPSPFVVLDEVDAALDEANSQRFAAILEQLAHKTQFITISHNRATMEKAGILYGVTMGDDGVSQLLSVKMDEVEEIIRSYGNR